MEAFSHDCPVHYVHPEVNNGDLSTAVKSAVAIAGLLLYVPYVIALLFHSGMYTGIWIAFWSQLCLMHFSWCCLLIACLFDISLLYSFYKNVAILTCLFLSSLLQTCYVYWFPVFVVKCGTGGWLCLWEDVMTAKDTNVFLIIFVKICSLAFLYFVFWFTCFAFLTAVLFYKYVFIYV